VLADKVTLTITEHVGLVTCTWHCIMWWKNVPS